MKFWITSGLSAFEVHYDFNFRLFDSLSGILFLFGYFANNAVHVDTMCLCSISINLFQSTFGGKLSPGSTTALFRISRFGFPSSFFRMFGLCSLWLAAVQHNYEFLVDYFDSSTASPLHLFFARMA